MTKLKLRIQLSLLLLSIWIGVCHAQARELGGDFKLTDQHGDSFELEQLRGKIVLLFFGYTYCPDICPTELSNLAAVLNSLDDREEEVRGVFVSLDPERDTPEVLQNYTHYFNENMLGLTGSQSEIDSVAKQYQVKFKRHQSRDGRYTLDHSANLYVIDRTGQLTTVVPYGLPPEHVLNIVHDLLNNGG